MVREEEKNFHAKEQISVEPLRSTSAREKKKVKTPVSATKYGNETKKMILLCKKYFEEFLRCTNSRKLISRNTGTLEDINRNLNFSNEDNIVLLNIHLFIIYSLNNQNSLEPEAISVYVNSSEAL